MRFGTWVLARSRADGAMLLTLFATTVLISLALVGADGYLSGSTAAGVRQVLHSEPLPATVTQISTGLAPDPAAQANAASRLFGSVFSGLPVVIDRSVASGRLPVDHRGTGAGLTVAFRSYDGLDTRVRVVRGAWPVPRSGSVLPVAMRRQCRGLELSGGRRDRGAYRQRGDLRSIGRCPGTDRTGGSFLYDEDVTPAALVGASDLAALGVSLQVRWTIGVDEPTVTSAGLERLHPVLAELRRTVNNDVSVNTRGVQESGSLAGTVALINAGVVAAAGVAPVAPTLITAVGVLMILTVTRLLTASRRPGLSLLSSRGMGRGQLVGAAAVEAAVVATSAAGLGIGCAAALLSRNGFPLALRWSWVVVFAVVVSVVGVAAGATLAEVRRFATAGNGGRVRARRVVGAGSAVLLAAAVGVALWRFRQLGGAVTTVGDGPARVDPVAVLAPALCLVGVGQLGAAVIGVGTAAISTTVGPAV